MKNPITSSPMMNLSSSSSSSSDHWVKSALKNDTLVAELLLQLKQSSDSDSFKPTKTTTKDVTTPSKTFLLLPPGWSNRRIRSKSAKKDHRGSPTTHLSWSFSGSDGVSDLSYGARSIKANEGASTSSYNNKSLKRKAFFDHKDDEEGSLFKGRIHVNKELTSKLVTLNQQSAKTTEIVKRIKVDPDQKPIIKMGRMGDHEIPVKAPPLANQSVKISIRVEPKIEAPRGGFVLPDLNVPLNEDDLIGMS